MKQNKNKTKKFIKQAFREEYPPFYLAVSLAFFTLVIAFTLGTLQAQDWSEGFALLDISDQVAATYQGFNQAVEPMVAFASSVNTFYEVASDEMAQLLVVEDFEESLVPIEGVTRFYELASLEMEQLLDLSALLPMDLGFEPKVAGACVQN